jgi:hypothetical protein
LIASPRVGDKDYTHYVSKKVPRSWCIINEQDLVPNLPPSTYADIGKTQYYDKFDNIILEDIQCGNIRENHSLPAYVCGLDLNAKECPDRVLWKTGPHHIANIDDNTERLG